MDPNFHEVNGLFVLSFEDNSIRTGHAGFFLLAVEIKDFNVYY